MQIQYELLRTTSKQIFESYIWYSRQIKNSWKISPYTVSLVHFSRYLCVRLTETITCFASRKISVAPLVLNPLSLALVVSRKANVGQFKVEGVLASEIRIFFSVRVRRKKMPKITTGTNDLSQHECTLSRTISRITVWEATVQLATEVRNLPLAR